MDTNSTRRVGCGLALVLAGALLAGCTAGDADDTASTDTTEASDAPVTTVLTGPSPGVTDEAIRVGVTYVDLSSLAGIVDIDHGDYEAAYNALFDAINAEGGISGRTIEPVLLGINPTTTDSAEAACVELTEDEDVFLVMGFFLNESVSCVVGAHATATIGGSMTDELLGQAEAPWFTTETGSDASGDAVRAMIEAGAFDGTLGVFAGPGGDQAEMENTILPLLEEEGIEVADSAVNDAPTDDVTAANAQTAVIAERFESEGIDQVLTVGQSGLGWALGTGPLDYRPQMLLTNPNSVLALVSDPANDLSVLDGAVAGNLYGGPQNLYELPAMQDCLGVLSDAGIDVPEPESAGPDDPTPWTSAFTACGNVALMRAVLEAAGEDLNYGTLAAGATDLEVQLPIQPDPVTYGPPPAADGNPPMYLFDWDPSALANGDFVLSED